MDTKLGTSADEGLKVLGQHDITPMLAKQVIEVARENGAFTVFAVVDALTRLSAKLAHARETAGADERADLLFALAA